MSDPAAIGTPASAADRTVRRWLAASRSESPGPMAARVGTNQQPRVRITFTAFSSRKKPCSTLRTPARAAAIAARAVCACASTSRPQRPASSTTAANSAAVGRTSRPVRTWRTAPPAPSLIQSAPARTIRRTAARAASGPSNTGFGRAGSSSRSTLPMSGCQVSPSPPVGPSCRKLTSRSGPSIQPSRKACVNPASAPEASRTVVMPRDSRRCSVLAASSIRALCGSGSAAGNAIWAWQSIRPGISRHPLPSMWQGALG